MCVYREIFHLFIAKKNGHFALETRFSTILFNGMNDGRALTSTGLLANMATALFHALTRKMRKLHFAVQSPFVRVRRFPPISMESFIDDCVN